MRGGVLLTAKANNVQGETLTSGVVFVYGALRSGTTLFRLMLQAAPSISNPGEADFLFDYIAPNPGGGWQYDRASLSEDRMFQSMALILPDKDGLELLADLLAQLQMHAAGQVVTLNLHRNLDRLLCILPGARLIHVLRDPRDVARSSIGMGWAGTLYHGVNHWISTESAWDNLAIGFSPGQTFELSYEAFFTDAEAMLRRVCAFLGCDYDPAMLGYYRSTTYGPPDASLINQWKRNASRAELAPLEAKAAALMTRRGYSLSGPIEVPGPWLRAGLALKNRIANWHFGIRRFGAGLYVGEKLTRWLGLSALHGRIRSRMKVIAIRHLK